MVERRRFRIFSAPMSASQHASKSSKIVCFGEILLRLSAPGRELLLQSPQLDAHVGGAEANVAVALARLGHASAVVSALPESSLGHVCASELRRHGADTSAIEFRDGRMGMYFLTHGAGPRPAEVLYDRANSAFAIAPPALYDWKDLLRGASWLHVSGITPAVSDSAAQAAKRAVSAACENGVRVSFDCNFRERLWAHRVGQAPEILRELVSHASLLFGDDRDIELMFGKQSFGDAAADRRRNAAAFAFAKFPALEWLACTERQRHSVETQDYMGALYSRTDSYASRPFKLTGIVDRIGAGDAFAAGVLHGLIAGLGPTGTVDFATAAACLKHTIPGDFNLLGVADVELLLSDHRMDVRR
jgi:2-dehydro-3-deoxygluconokinase